MNEHVPSRKNHFLLLAGAVVLLALLLRLSVSTQLYTGYPAVQSPAPATDNYTYQQLATLILDGNYDYQQGFYYQPFYYAVFLPVVYALSGRSVWGVIIVQSLLGAGAVWLTIMTAAQLFGRRAGLIAGGLLALARFHIFYTPFTLIAALQSFWVILLTYCAVRAMRRRRYWLWAATGMVCGLATCTRGNMVLMMPVLAAAILYTGRLQWRPTLLRMVVLALFFYLPQLPFAMLNYRAHGRWVGPSSAAGNVLALGNTPESPPGGLEPGNAGPMAYPESYGYWTRLAESGERSVAASVRQWILREPMAFGELKFRMFLLFWNRMEIPNNVSILRDGQPIKSWLLHLPVLIDFWLLGSLGVAGLLLALRYWRQHPSRTMVAGLTLVYAGSIVMFYVLARFRLPIVPLLCVFGGFASCRAWLWLTQLKNPPARRRALLKFTALAACFLFVGAGYQIYRFGWEARIMTMVRPAGTHLDLGDEYLVFDHGPQRFGGWQMLPIGDGILLEKDLLLPAMAANPRSVTLLLPIVATSGGMIEVQANQALQAFPIKVEDGESPIHWIRWELAPETYVYTQDGRFTVLVQVRQVSGQDAGLIIDHQRDYGRTLIDQQPSAELVMRLLLKP